VSRRQRAAAAPGTDEEDEKDDGVDAEFEGEAGRKEDEFGEGEGCSGMCGIEQVCKAARRDGLANAEDEWTAAGHPGIGVGDLAEIGDEKDEGERSADEEEQRRSPGAVEDDLPRGPADDDEEEGEGGVDGDSECAGESEAMKRMVVGRDRVVVFKSLECIQARRKATMQQTMPARWWG